MCIRDRTDIGLGAPDQALPHLERALALSTARGDGGGEAASEMALATIRLRRGDYAAAEALLRKVRRYLLAHERDVDPEMAFIATSDLSTVIGYLRPGDAEALELIREAIAVADRANITAGVAVAGEHIPDPLHLSPFPLLRRRREALGWSSGGPGPLKKKERRRDTI